MQSKDLSAGAREAIARKAIAGAWELGALLRLFDELERWDLTAEARKQSAEGLRTAGKIATTVSIVMLVLMLIVAQSLDLVAYMLAGVAASIGLLLLGRHKVKAAAGMDLPDELRLTIRPFLRQLSGDIEPGGKIRVNLDLRSFELKPTKDGVKANPQSRKPAPPANLTIYEDPLGSLRLPLADGCSAILRISNVYHKVVKNKRSRSGKFKSKLKWKKMSAVTGILIPPEPVVWQEARIRPFLNPKQEIMSFVKKDGVTIARIDRSFKFKSPTVRPTDLAPLGEIMSIFVRLVAMRPAQGASSK